MTQLVQLFHKVLMAQMMTQSSESDDPEVLLDGSKLSPDDSKLSSDDSDLSSVDSELSSDDSDSSSKRKENDIIISNFVGI